MAKKSLARRMQDSLGGAARTVKKVAKKVAKKAKKAVTPANKSKRKKSKR